MSNLEDKFDNLKFFELEEQNFNDAIDACINKFGMDRKEVKENPFMVIAMYQAMGVVHMAQGQQAVLKEMRAIVNKLEQLETAVKNR